MRKWIGLGIVIALLVIGIIVYRYFWQNTPVDQFNVDDQGFNYSGEMGDLKVDYTDPAFADFGVPVYPGAEVVYEDSVGEVTIGDKQFLMGSFTTSDSKAVVADYYDNQIEGAIVGTLEGDKTQTIIKAPNGTSINISTQDPGAYIVIVKPL